MGMLMLNLKLLALLLFQIINIIFYISILIRLRLLAFCLHSFSVLSCLRAYRTIHFSANKAATPLAKLNKIWNGTNCSLNRQMCWKVFFLSFSTFLLCDSCVSTFIYFFVVVKIRICLSNGPFFSLPKKSIRRIYVMVVPWTYACDAGRHL